MRVDNLSINKSSSFEKILSRIDKTINRVNHIGGVPNCSDTDDWRDDVDQRECCDAPSHESEEDIRDEAIDVRLHQQKYLDRLEALACKVTKSVRHSLRPSTNPVNKCLADHADRLPSKEVKYAVPPKRFSPEANSVIWRAYATTKSFASIIHGVVATQALMRGWLTVKRVEKRRREIQVKNTAAQTLEVAMDKFHSDPEYNIAIRGELYMPGIMLLFLPYVHNA